ncbi:MAG: ribonuclease T2 family protein [Bryobacteraceae bacterium]
MERTKITAVAPAKTLSIGLICLLAATAADARSHKKTHQSDQPTFSYYLLSLTYAPDFCAQPTGNKDPRECGAGRRIGLVVHGLWPQVEGNRGPENCGSASPVSEEIVRLMLPYIPTESLIRHEWATHGTCTGLKAADYFTFVRRARDMVKIPNELAAPGEQLRMGSSEIEAKFAAANPSFPRGAFRVSCYRDAELQEVRIAFNKDLSPRVYGTGGGSCGATLQIRPVR